MRHSRMMSLVEAVVNVMIGFGVAVATQLLMFPALGLHTTLGQNLAIGLIFTVVSLVRSYALRRAFETILGRSGGERPAATLGGHPQADLLERPG